MLPSKILTHSAPRSSGTSDFPRHRAEDLPKACDHERATERNAALDRAKRTPAKIAQISAAIIQSRVSDPRYAALGEEQKGEKKRIDYFRGAKIRATLNGRRESRVRRS